LKAVALTSVILHLKSVLPIIHDPGGTFPLSRDGESVFSPAFDLEADTRLSKELGLINGSGRVRLLWSWWPCTFQSGA